MIHADPPNQTQQQQETDKGLHTTNNIIIILNFRFQCCCVAIESSHTLTTSSSLKDSGEILSLDGYSSQIKIKFDSPCLIGIQCPQLLTPVLFFQIQVPSLWLQQSRQTTADFLYHFWLPPRNSAPMWPHHPKRTNRTTISKRMPETQPRSKSHAPIAWSSTLSPRDLTLGLLRPPPPGLSQSEVVTLSLVINSGRPPKPQGPRHLQCHTFKSNTWAPTPYSPRPNFQDARQKIEAVPSGEAYKNICWTLNTRDKKKT